MSISDRTIPLGKIVQLQPFLYYKGQELFIEKISCREIAQQYGTPLFIFSKNRIVDNVRTFSTAFRNVYNKVDFFYPYRANYLPLILSEVHAEGWGAEVTSPLEYKIAKLVNSSRIIINGYNRKLYPQILSDEKVFYVVLDSLEDAGFLSELAQKAHRVVDVALRVHPDLYLSEKVSLVPRGFKLGYDIRSGDAEAIVTEVSNMPGLNIMALNTHVANRQLKPDLHVEALKSLLKFAEKLHRKHKINVDYINIGGGFESRNLLEVNSSLEYFADEFKKLMSNTEREYGLILEPGRYIVSDSAITLTKTITKKINAGHKWIIVDIGTNTLIPLKSASFDIIPVVLDNEYDFFNVGDFIASSIGVIQQNIKLPQKTKIGDIFAIINTGAYTLSMSEQFVLLRPKVIMVDNDQVKTLKEREKEEYFVERIQTAEW